MFQENNWPRYNNNKKITGYPNVIPVTTEEQWVEIKFETFINGSLQINRIYDGTDLENDITAIITNIKVESEG